MKTHQILFQIGLAAILPTAASAAIVRIENYGAPTVSEQTSFNLINRFRADPVNELARMFNDNFGTTHTNTTLGQLLDGVNYSANFWSSTFSNNVVSGSMNFFQTSPNVLYDEFQAMALLPPRSPYTWNNNIGWAAHQYAARVEADAGATQNPHLLPGPDLGTRISNVGVNWSNLGENIAPNWLPNPATMHMAFAVDWGTGTNGMQNPRGHRDAMMSALFTNIGIGTVDEGWGFERVTQVQKLAALSPTNPTNRIAYGYVYTDASATTKAAGATVNIYDAAGNLLGSTTSDSSGAYTYIVSSTATAPATAEFIQGSFTTARHALGNDGNTWFLDAAVIPEPSSALLAGLAILGACARRRRVD